MSLLLKACGLGLTAALFALMVEARHQQAGRLVGLCAGLMLMLLAVTQLEPVVQALEAFSRNAGLQNETLMLLFRLIAMAYVTEFAAQACHDAGQPGLAAKTALTGKILLAAQSAPLVVQIGSLALSFLP